MLIGNSLWQLIKQADMISWLVLFILFSLSVVCWTIFFCKLIVARLKQRHVRYAIRLLTKAHTLDDMQQLATRMQGTVPGYVITKHLNFFKSLKKAGHEAPHSHEFEMLQQQGEQLLDTLVTHEESYVPILSTTAAVAPLLGLFGTVWGLVRAFIGISERQTADIVAVAPGIAQALMTTLAGLVVAIPALVMFNYLHVNIRSFEQQLITLIDLVQLQMKRIMQKGE